MRRPCQCKRVLLWEIKRPTLLSREVSILRSDVLKLLSGWVDDLHIAREVLVTIHFREVVESFVGNLGNIEFVVADGEQIVVHVFKDGVRDVAVWLGGVA